MVATLPVMSDVFLSKLYGLKPTDTVDVIVAAKPLQGLEGNVEETRRDRMSFEERMAALAANEQALQPVTSYLTEIGATYSTYAALRRAGAILTVQQVLGLAGQPSVAYIIENQAITLV